MSLNKNTLKDHGGFSATALGVPVDVFGVMGFLVLFSTFFSDLSLIITREKITQITGNDCRKFHVIYIKHFYATGPRSFRVPDGSHGCFSFLFLQLDVSNDINMTYSFGNKFSTFKRILLTIVKLRKLTFSHKQTKILTINRKSHNPTETLLNGK